MQYAMIALLTCLEALLGVINACLPVMKPIFNMLGDTRALAFLATWNSTWTGSRRSHASRSNRTHQSKARRSEGGPAGSGSKGIKRKASHLMFSQDLPSEIRSPMASGATSPRRPVSKFHRPMGQWDYGSLETVDANAIHVKTDWDVEHRASEDRLPIRPLRQPGETNGTRWYS